MVARASHGTAGAALIVLACLTVALTAWQQEREIAEAHELIASENPFRDFHSQGRDLFLGAETGNLDEAEHAARLDQWATSSRAVAEKTRERARAAERRLLRPTVLLPLALLFALAGLRLLLRRSPLEAANPGSLAPSSNSDESRSPDSDLRAARLLARQRGLAEAERKALATEFAASISHEIRNPLAGIQMGLSNLIAESTDALVSDRLRLLSAETVRLADLLAEAVAVARRSPEDSRELNLLNLVEQLFDLLRFQTPTKLRLEHDIEEGLGCRLPPNRFRHCMANLLINSAQAIGDDEGWVRVEMGNRAEYLRIRVLDSGPGFPQDILRGGHHPSAARDSQGAALGLAMVRRFVREMGGKLELSNLDRSGSASGGCVTILLPSAGHHG